MGQKRCPRRVWLPMPPRGLRPKLDRGQLLDLAAAHLVNLDQMVSGRADEDLLWQVVEQTLVWSRVAELLELGMDEMRLQLDMVKQVVQRYGRTGRVGFSGQEYQIAKAGIDVMDQLAEATDKATAVAAAQWAASIVVAMQTAPLSQVVAQTEKA